MKSKEALAQPARAINGGFFTLFAGRIIVAAMVFWSGIARAQYNPNPAAGPYYFVSDSCGDDQCSTTGQFFWRTGHDTNGVEKGTAEAYAGIQMVANFNLFARVLGDVPPSSLPSGQTLVGTATFPALGNLLLQPLAVTMSGSSKKLDLPIGKNLRAKLNDPLNGVLFDLTLPFTDPNVALSDHSAIIRGGTDSGVWHVAVDFDYNTALTEFDVVAAANGTVEGNTFVEGTNSCGKVDGGTPIVLRHTAANGKQFFTIYQHLRPESPKTDDSLSVGRRVVRGQKLGRTKLVTYCDGSQYAHLHFTLAVEGPSGTDLGGKAIPETKYLLDPFGVYDYRRNKASTTDYNYLPNNRLDLPTRGRIHAYAWRTDPVIGSLLLPEDCVLFNPLNLQLIQSGTQVIIVDGTHGLFAFPNKTEATTALNIIKQYGANQSCFIGRPNASFQYLLIDGRSPAGAAAGEDCISFDPAKIALNVLSDGRVQMVSGSQSMFIFPNMLEAGNALSMIKKYGFTKTCFVGRPDASLQYMRKDSGATGTFELLPADAAVAVQERLNFTFTWFVPAPLVWRDLEHLQFRIREGEETILSVLFDEKSNAFVHLNETTGRPERGFLPGQPNRLESSHATLHLADTTVVGSGPTGQSVTLNLALSFKPQAAGRVFDVEVAATNDFGQRDEFAHAGWLTVKPAKTVLIDEPEAEAEEVP